ncbi:19498_t:CDS:1, partial [Gigaspora rosea]
LRAKQNFAYTCGTVEITSNLRRIVELPKLRFAKGVIHDICVDDRWKFRRF